MFVFWCFIFVMLTILKLTHGDPGLNIGNYPVLSNDGFTIKVFFVSDDPLITSPVTPKLKPQNGNDEDQIKCNDIQGFSTGQQMHCQVFEDHIESILRGFELSLKECKSQFKGQRWNCNIPNDSEIVLTSQMFKANFRETAFLQSIFSAGVMYSVAKACREGSLISCTCSDIEKPLNLSTSWIWGGCSDNLNYGYRFTEGLMDIREREKLGRKRQRKNFKEYGGAYMALQNNEAGRRAILKTSRIVCKCHGMSGSCTLSTCWQRVSSFKEVGEYLKDKYNSATEVKINRNNGRLVMKNMRFNVPTLNDLVYINSSPNYCLPNDDIGVAGTQGRECNRTSAGMDGCDLLCCGRGYNSESFVRRARCNCQFHWCCYVHCDVCTVHKETNTCK